MGKVKNDGQTFSSSIGAIVIDFEKSIFAFSVIINCLTNSKDGDKIYKKKCSSKDKISDYRVIIKKIAPDTLKQESLKLLAELGKIRELRNHLVHSIWYELPYKKATIDQQFIKKGKSRDTIQREYNMKEAKEIASSLRWLTHDIHMHLHDRNKWNINAHPEKYGRVFKDSGV